MPEELETLRINLILPENCDDVLALAPKSVDIKKKEKVKKWVEKSFKNLERLKLTLGGELDAEQFFGLEQPGDKHPDKVLLCVYSKDKVKLSTFFATLGNVNFKPSTTRKDHIPYCGEWINVRHWSSTLRTHGGYKKPVEMIRYRRILKNMRKKRKKEELRKNMEEEIESLRSNSELSVAEETCKNCYRYIKCNNRNRRSKMAFKSLKNVMGDKPVSNPDVREVLNNLSSYETISSEEMGIWSARAKTCRCRLPKQYTTNDNKIKRRRKVIQKKCEGLNDGSKWFTDKREKQTRQGRVCKCNSRSRSCLKSPSTSSCSEYKYKEKIRKPRGKIKQYARRRETSMECDYRDDTPNYRDDTSNEPSDKSNISSKCEQDKQTMSCGRDRVNKEYRDTQEWISQPCECNRRRSIAKLIDDCKCARGAVKTSKKLQKWCRRKLSHTCKEIKQINSTKSTQTSVQCVKPKCQNMCRPTTPRSLHDGCMIQSQKTQTSDQEFFKNAQECDDKKPVNMSECTQTSSINQRKCGKDSSLIAVDRKCDDPCPDKQVDNKKSRNVVEPPEAVVLKKNVTTEAGEGDICKPFDNSGVDGEMCKCQERDESLIDLDRPFSDCLKKNQDNDDNLNNLKDTNGKCFCHNCLGKPVCSKCHKTSCSCCKIHKLCSKNKTKLSNCNINQSKWCTKQTNRVSSREERKRMKLINAPDFSKDKGNNHPKEADKNKVRRNKKLRYYRKFYLEDESDLDGKNNEIVKVKFKEGYRRRKKPYREECFSSEDSWNYQGNGNFSDGMNEQYLNRGIRSSDVNDSIKCVKHVRRINRLEDDSLDDKDFETICLNKAIQHMVPETKILAKDITRHINLINDTDSEESSEKVPYSEYKTVNEFKKAYKKCGEVESKNIVVELIGKPTTYEYLHRDSSEYDFKCCLHRGEINEHCRGFKCSSQWKEKSQNTLHLLKTRRNCKKVNSNHIIKRESIKVRDQSTNIINIINHKRKSKKQNDVSTFWNKSQSEIDITSDFEDITDNRLIMQINNDMDRNKVNLRTTDKDKNFTVQEQDAKINSESKEIITPHNTELNTGEYFETSTLQNIYDGGNLSQKVLMVDDQCKKYAETVKNNDETLRKLSEEKVNARNKSHREKSCSLSRDKAKLSLVHRKGYALKEKKERKEEPTTSKQVSTKTKNIPEVNRKSSPNETDTKKYGDLYQQSFSRNNENIITKMYQKKAELNAIQTVIGIRNVSENNGVEKRYLSKELMARETAQVELTNRSQGNAMTTETSCRVRQDLTEKTTIKKQIKSTK